MTSMPASRSARAMIFAPRSCPSRPGFATTTLIFPATNAVYGAYESPTAQTLPDVRAATPEKLSDPTGATVATIFHRRPFQCSASGALFLLAPTAQTSVEETALTARSESDVEDDGAVTMRQLWPSQYSTSTRM